MKPQFDFFLRVDSHLKMYFARLTKSLTNSELSLSPYPNNELVRRISQILIRDNYKRFLKYFAADPNFLLKPQKLIVQKNGIKFTPSDQDSVCVEFAFGTVLFARFLLIAKYYLLQGFLSIFRSAQIKTFTLLFSPGLEMYLEKQTLEADFENYCLNGPLPIFRQKNNFLVTQDAREIYVDRGRILFSKHPYRTVYQKTHFTILDFVTLFLETLFTTVTMLKSWLAGSPIALLYRDLALQPSVFILNKKKVLSDIVLTNSSFYDQEIWLNALPDRSFKSHMIWYSTNTRAMDYKTNADYLEHPAVSLISVDCAWTWNQDHAAWIKQSTASRSTELCGPILYTLPPTKDKNPIYDILIFDVTPVIAKWMDEHYTDNIYYYFQTENMIKFVDDILQIGRELGLKVAIKHKRDHSPIHDQKYIDFIAAKESEGLIVLPPLNNLFETISESQLSIVVPFSSPAYVAMSLGRPVAFYDAPGVLKTPEWLDSGVKFISSKNELRLFVAEIINNK